MQEAREQRPYNDRHHQKKRRREPRVGNAQAADWREHARLPKERHGRPAHDADVHRIERNHGEYAGEQIQHAQMHVEKTGAQAGQAAGGERRGGSGIGVPALDDQHGGDCSAEGEAAIDREIGEIEDAECEENPEGDETVDEPDLDRPEDGDQRHGGRA